MIPDIAFCSTVCYHVCQLLGKVDGMDPCVVRNILNLVEAGNRIGWYHMMNNYISVQSARELFVRQLVIQMYI